MILLIVYIVFAGANGSYNRARRSVMITVVTFVEYLAVVVGFMLSESMCV